MLRAKTEDGVLFLGLDAENVRHIQAGNPIFVNLEQIGGAHTVVLMYGDTLADIRRELERVSGAPLPLAKPLPGGH